MVGGPCLLFLWQTPRTPPHFRGMAKVSGREDELTRARERASPTPISPAYAQEIVVKVPEFGPSE